MRRLKKWFTLLLSVMLLVQNLPAAAVEAAGGTSPVRANVLYAGTVRGGSHANTTAAAGSTTLPREILEAKWAGDMSFSRRSFMEFNIPDSVDWSQVTGIKLMMYLKEHSGAGKTDTIQVYKTEKPAKSEENWTWNETSSLIDGNPNAVVVGEQAFTDINTASWVEIDVTDLKAYLAADPELKFSLALYPKATADQGGIRFYSPYQESGKYAPYLNIYQGTYTDTLSPAVKVTGLTDGQETAESNISFQVQAADNNDANPSIHISVNGQAQTGINGSNTVALDMGKNRLEISAQDAAGNESDVQTYIISRVQTDTYPVTSDAYIDIRYPTTNYNTATSSGGLQLKKPATGTSDRYVYLSFDLSANPLPYVKKAQIGLYVYELMGTDKTSEAVNIYATSDFNEATLTWNNAPADGGKVAEVSYSRSAAGTYIYLDVTNYINKKLASGTNLGRLNFVLKAETGHDQKGVHFASKERYPNYKANMALTSGLPAPSVTVTGITDHSIYKTDTISDVTITAKSVNDVVTVTKTVTVNGTEVSPKSGDIYDIPLELGTNKIIVTATDQEENVTEAAYTVTRLMAAGKGTYYVDSVSGDDSNDGLSEGAPWKSLQKLNQTEFQPGSKLLFKRGSIWNGQLRPMGSGTEAEPIVIDAYGVESSKPVINGNGISNLDTGNAIAEGAVHLYNLSYWEINNLEVTNTGAELANASRAGVMVVAGGNGYVQHVHVKNVYVHDVNTHPDAQKISGGIIFRGDTMDEKGNYTNVDSGFRDILVEDCHVKNVVVEGLRTKTYKNSSDTGSIKNYDVVFKNNLVEDIYGDGIVISEIASGGLVEKNIIRRHSTCPTNKNYAGLWLYQTNGVICQYNEVYDGVHGYNDGEAFDFDIGATNNIYQYNYSHNNKGGFLLTMSSSGTGNVFRYNISKNDGNGNEIFFCMRAGTKIYNNTIYVGEGITLPYFIDESSDAVKNMYFKNNILMVDGTINKYSGRTDTYTAPEVSHNIIYPASVAGLAGSPSFDGTLITEDPMLVNAAAGSIIMDEWTQSIWDTNIGHFKVREGSPAIDAGAVIDNAGATDIYGTPLYVNGKADIGAQEYLAKKLVTSITVNGAGGAASVTNGNTLQMSAAVLPEDATDKSVIWSVTSVSGSAVISGDGLLTATGAGTVIVQATAGDGSGISGTLEILITAADNMGKSIVVGGQNETITAGTAGSVNFTVNTAQIAEGIPVTAYWCDLSGNASPAPAGLTISGSAISVSGSSITVTADETVPAGTYYFKVTSDGVTSGMAAVTISAPVIAHIVTFVDWNGSILKIETVNRGGAATAPANPGRSGYTFTGWDRPFGNITGNLTVTAQYSRNSTGGYDGGGYDGGGTIGTPTALPDIEYITVGSNQGAMDSTVSQITIKRSTNEDGQKTDSVIYQAGSATETVKNLKKANKETARIVIPDEKNEVSDTKINIPSESIKVLSDGEVNLQIETKEAKLAISKETLNKISGKPGDGLYFHLSPVSKETEKKQLESGAVLAVGLVKGNAEKSTAVLGNPVAIETNMTSLEADITLPLTGIEIPLDQKEREAFLKQLAVYIKHSDGEEELVQGEIVEYREGVYAIRFHITKFSSFVIVKTDAFLQSPECSVIKVTAPSKATIKGSSITASVDNKVSSITVKLTVSGKAAWKLYSDKACSRVIAKRSLKLKTGTNKAYVKVTAEDGKTSKVYTLKVTRKSASRSRK